MSHQIFISFSSQNSRVASELCSQLERLGVQCWISSRDIEPGKDYAAQIVEAISGSRMLLLVFTKESNTSRHVLREVERAVSRGLAIVPLRIDDVPLSPTAFGSGPRDRMGKPGPAMTSKGRIRRSTGPPD